MYFRNYTYTCKDKSYLFNNYITIIDPVFVFVLSNTERQYSLFMGSLVVLIYGSITTFSSFIFSLSICTLQTLHEKRQP